MKMKTLLLTIAATIGLTAETMAQNVPNYVPTNGLVGWWPFNGNANDESGNGNNGTVNGATLTSDRFGNSNKAYSFDGLNDFISTNYSGVLGTNNRSVSFWARHNNSFDPNQCASCSRKPVISYGSNVQGPSQIGKGFYCEFNIGLTGISFDGNETAAAYSTPSPVNDLNWHHYVYVFNNVTNSSSVKIYQDAILLTQLSYTYLPSSILNTLLGANMDFGRRTYNQQGPSFYNGDLDDIGFWSRALTQQEISDLFNANICYQNITVTDTLLINMGITGFNPITYNNTIKIFPNPTNDHITIDYGNFASLNGYQLKIENSLGQQVFQTNINQQSNYLSLNKWGGNGLYFVRIIDPQGNTIDIRKIVLQ
jgi:hypothetical protein